MNRASVLPILDELIEAYKNENVFRFLHLPVQSGSDSVLKRMNRRYGAQDFMDIINAFRKALPDCTLWTDIIAGFPGESDSDFEQSISLLKKAKPDFTNVSAFGSRPGTAAARMKQLASEIRKQRTRLLTILTDEISIEQNKRWVGWRGACLIDEYNQKKGNFIARNHCYKPVALKSGEIGRLADVKIVSARKTCLIGELLSSDDL